MRSTFLYLAGDLEPVTSPLDNWSSILSRSLVTLRQLAGATEHDFLLIGSQMQGIYQNSNKLSETAHHLVEVASGERIRILTDKLHQILQEMKEYLELSQARNLSRCATLEAVESLLCQVVEPLEGFRKISKHLYILEVAIKIESTYLGEKEGEFLNLAQDVKKLSQLIKEKVNAVQDHQLLLAMVITKNIFDIQAASSNQDFKVRSTINDTAESLKGLELVNSRFSLLGTEISAVSGENSQRISEIVQSMQIHDIYRQQVEHVIESLEGIVSSFNDNIDGDDLSQQRIIEKAGDVCELQDAQLRFASAELYTAVMSVVTHLHDISTQQKQMGSEIYSQVGTADASSSSFIDNVSERMSSITDLLTTCTAANSELAVVTKKVTDEVEEITNFVFDIENIGHDIIQIALNSRIKAVSTGKNGASLSALSEEIGQLSSETVQRADSITGTLAEIQSAIASLSIEANSNEKNLSTNLLCIKEELSQALIILEKMGDELLSLLPQLQNQINTLASEIESIADGINAHERTKTMADEVLSNLQQIFNQSRALYPASTAFKEDLRRMAERYTMESERRIHEDIAGKHGVQLSMTISQSTTSAKSEDSEFGDNVDLF